MRPRRSLHSPGFLSCLKRGSPRLFAHFAVTLCSFLNLRALQPDDVAGSLAPGARSVDVHVRERLDVVPESQSSSRSFGVLARTGSGGGPLFKGSSRGVGGAGPTSEDGGRPRIWLDSASQSSHLGENRCNWRLFTVIETGSGVMVASDYRCPPKSKLCKTEPSQIVVRPPLRPSRVFSDPPR